MATPRPRPRRASRRLRTLLVLTAAITTVVTACSGDDGTLDLGRSEVVTTDAPTGPSTSLPATVAPPTTSPPPTPSTTTTTTPADPGDDIEAQIRADFARTVELRSECGINPETCPYALIATPGSQFDAGLRSLMAQRIKDGLRSKPGEGEFSYVVESVTVMGETALITVCGVDSVVLFDIADPSNPNDDIIFDESVVSSRTHWTLDWHGGRWLRSAGETTLHTIGPGLCDEH